MPREGGGVATRHAITLVSVLFWLAATLPVHPAAADEINSTKGFRKAVTLQGIRAHQATLQAIADAAGGNRLAGTTGHDESAQYVYERALGAGYDVSFQEFAFELVSDRTPPELEQVSPTAKAYVDGVDFATMSYSGSGDVTAEVVAVDLVVPPPGEGASTSGCEATDFAGFPAGAIALVQRGTCFFQDKAENARVAGAAGVIVFNDGFPGRTGVIFGGLDPTLFALPVVGATSALGDELRNGVLNGPTGVTVHLLIDTVAEERSTRNVIAETATGDPTRVVVIGAHLDSVSRGPGINDNGSGSAMILEIAEVYAAQGREPRNKLRFIWFSAEEQGLIGSGVYVDSLSQAERAHILVMLDYDMVGSPNFVRFVYDGDGSAAPPDPPAAGPPGSALIEQVFLDYFASQGLATEPTPFDGRSDYGQFIAVGIPAGGLFTGAEGGKTPAQVLVYGGVAGQQYDPCYHLACDGLDNVSTTALDQMADAAAHAALFFSKTKLDVRAPSAGGQAFRTPAPARPNRIGPLWLK